MLYAKGAVDYCAFSFIKGCIKQLSTNTNTAPITFSHKKEITSSL